MSAGRYHMIIEQGATFHRVVEWRDEDGDLVNITDWTAQLQIRRKATDATVLASLSPTVDGPNGTVTLEMTDEETAALPSDIGVNGAVYDLELTSPAGDVTRLLQGFVTVSPEVTRV